jgi:hypothetical protein
MTPLLPGGLWERDAPQREFAFAPITGELELVLGMADGQRLRLVQRVTAVLCAALRHIGGAPATHDRVRALCVDDRRFLMQALAGEVGISTVWITGTCGACAGAFDLPAPPSRLPVKPAGPGYPFASTVTSLGPVRLRVPTGADQEDVGDLMGDAATRALIAGCLVAQPPGHDSPAAAAAAFTDEDVETISHTLEEVSPEVARCATGECPWCGAPIEVPLDPYLCLYVGPDRLLDEVETLAATYHWSEPDILSLPRERRRRYLRSCQRIAYAG